MRLFKQRASAVAADYLSRKYFPTKRRSRKRSSRRSSTGKRSSNAVTTHDHDFTSTYRRKRMPKHKRKRWVSFVRKVQAARATTAGLRSCGRTSIFSVTPAANAQEYTFMGLYSYNGGIGSAGPAVGFDTNDDMQQVLTNEDAIISSHKYMFQSGTIRMTATSVGQTSPVVIPVSACVLHIYSLGVRDDIVPGVLSGINPSNLFFDSYTLAGQIGAAGKISGTQMIATPFNNSNFLRFFKIYSVKKIQLEANESFSWEFRDPKNHVVNGSDVPVWGAKRGITKYWFMTVVGVPASTGQTAPCKVQFVVTKNYNYYEMENNQVATGNV